jgi:hypothetical protein
MHAYPLDIYALRLFLRRRIAYLRRAWGALARALRRSRAAVQRFNDQQRRYSAVAMSMDTHMVRPDSAPDTFSEFLFRTRGPLVHEPSATARLTGHGVR